MKTVERKSLSPNDVVTGARRHNHCSMGREATIVSSPQNCEPAIVRHLIVVSRLLGRVIVVGRIVGRVLVVGRIVGRSQILCFPLLGGHRSATVPGQS